MQLSYFAPCAKGLEYLLVDELKAIGCQEVREALAGVHFSGPLEAGYRAVLWSRLASRILMILKVAKVSDVDSVYQAVRTVEWQSHFSSERSFVIDFNGSSSYIKHTQFGAQKVKDAIVDQFKAHRQARPNVDTEQPDIRINAHLHRDELTLSIDLSGRALHERGYRPRAGLAPIKETLAAAILMRTPWLELSKQGVPLIDPCCGSGTIPIEAALMACDIAPGLFREDFGFTQGWQFHDDVLWSSIRNEATQRAEQGLSTFKGEIIGCDADDRLICVAQENAERAGVESLIKFKTVRIDQLQAPASELKGVVVANPPYGERLGTVETLLSTYEALGERLLESFQGWHAAIITSEPALAKAMRLRSHKQYSLYNGALPCKLYLFDIKAESKWTPPEELTFTLSEGAEAFRNRLQKNAKHLSSWLKREDISCYRVYDADLPEYAAAIDVYGGDLFIQEYQAPSKIPEALAQRRLKELVQVAQEVLSISEECTHLRTRRKQKGESQYEKLDQSDHYQVVEEGGLKFWVNLQDFLDTGLFLDHRTTRSLVRERVKGKNVLNLFSYTGSVSVYAASGGAATVTSVDMSRTYSDWALQNFELNELHGGQYRFIQADVMQWLPASKELYDVIFVDPPTFSNSKRMDDVFDVQRDHVALLKLCLERLKPGGEIIFSNNFRRFSLEHDALNECCIEDWSKRTIPMDFARDQRIHHCWRITRR